MSELDFERIIQQKLQETDFAPSSKSWDTLQQKWKLESSRLSHAHNTPVKKTLEVNIFSWKNIGKIAAVLLPLIACGIAYQQGIFSAKKIEVASHTKTNSNPVENQTNVPNTTATQTAIDDKTQDSPTFDASAINSKQQTSKNVASVPNKYIAESADFFNNNANNKDNKKAIFLETKKEEKQITFQPSPIEFVNKKPVQFEPKGKENSNDNSNQKSVVIAEIPSIEKQIPNKVLPEDIVVPSNKKYQTKPTISLLSMASSNVQNVNGNAVQIGLAVEKRMNKRLYVDVTAAIGRNNPTWWQQNVNLNASNENTLSSSAKTGYNLTNPQNDVNAFGVNASNNSFVAGGNNIPVTELQTDASVADVAASRLASYQIEATPMVAYQLLHNFSVAAGAEVAKILNTKEYADGLNHIALHSRTAVNVNTWDAGVVGKLEYTLYKNIVIGYRYRQGVTNLVQGYNTTKRSFNSMIVKVSL
jgi:hypothetical protein